MSTYTDLIALAEQIRTAQAESSNTAELVGSTVKAVVEYIRQAVAEADYDNIVATIRQRLLEALDDISSLSSEADASIADALDDAQQAIETATTAAVEEVATSGGWANIIRDGSDDVDLMVTDDNGNKLAQFDGGHLRVKNFDSELAAVSAPDGTSIDFFVSDEDGNAIVAIHDGNIITKKFDSLQAETGKVPMYLTPQINTYVGDHLQLFKYPLTLLAEYQNWGVSLSVKTDSNNVRKLGRTLRRYFEFTPTTTGTYTIQASLCDRFHRVHFNGEFTVKVLSPTNPATKKNILVIGDSSVQGQTNNSGIPASEGASEDGTFCWTNEAKRLLTSSDTGSVGMPAGLGLTNIQFIGTKNTSGGRNEGVGGVTAEYFTGSSSPFYKNGAINYNTYLGQNSVYEDTSRKGVDLIYICLGGNETMATTIADGHLVRTKAAFKAHMRTMLDQIISQLITNTSATYYNPNLKIVLLTSAFGWIAGRGYHPYGSIEWGDGINTAMSRVVCWEAVRELAAESAYSPYVDAYLCAPQIDSENGYAYINKFINNYSDVYEIEKIENVHLNRAGQRMYGAAVARDILGRL